ncbi:chromatin structure-remodeling complex protein RSC7 [Geosmithia morbida]|uniref:Chromatin structure-remodeling complex protein RSC7 n=1 Tax=Geosmithia morbida TaxID=1094350 RepID=A0A9P5D1A5_9HYPO|nr:chromatin structure-remodeling complex protein RSC7 [Geosmithia morbida]KAF4122537.1 chromatin structure-remodeling complex protein RSC7 [Geosmithia morbida]
MAKIRLRLTRTSAAAENTPRVFEEVADESMPDADATRNDDDDDDEDAKPPNDSGDDDDDDDDDDGSGGADGAEEEEENGGDGVAEEAEGDKADESVTASSRDAQPAQNMVRRKRLGRPPKNRPPDWDPMVMVPADEVRDTPRRRGRGGWRGRGGRKGGAAPPKAEQVIDGEGTVAEIANDECVLPTDAEGEAKVDAMGNLQGGRDYRCRVFTVLGRGDRLYMLSTEPARCVGFRDSYLFFTKHRKLHKIIVDDEEKRDMISRDIIPHSYKGRSIGIVTARSVFREFGARIVVGGRRVIDDYNVALARADPTVEEGQLADPDDKFIPGQPYNKNQYVAWHGASAVYHTNQPSVPAPAGKPEYKKRKVNVNDTNWMLEHAREASIFNSGINAIRKLNNAGVYDIHTNVMQYPAYLQPTVARIEQVPPTVEGGRGTGSSSGTKFPPVPAKLARNFLVVDTYTETPPTGISPGAYSHGSGSGAPPTADFLSAFSCLDAVPEDVRDLLPAECRLAFDKAVDSEREWKGRWGPESRTMCRRDPIIDKAIVP